MPDDARLDRDQTRAAREQTVCPHASDPAAAKARMAMLGEAAGARNAAASALSSSERLGDEGFCPLTP
ncbi:hypothetical protein J2R96_004995 [Bradyrhizobium elkanii]|nr:hypothetical protein [Bradyrhizobium elkanii]